MLPLRGTVRCPPFRAVRRRGIAAATLTAALSALAFAGPGAGAAQAATYYVDRDSVGGACSDARTAADNTIATPWCSIPRALAATPAGATVAVRRGEYPRVDFTDFTRASYVTLTRHTGELPTIHGMELARMDHLRVRDLEFTSGVVVRTGTDLEFMDNELALTPAGSQTSSGYIIMDVHRARFEGNWIHDGRDAINFSGLSRPSTDVVIRGNHFQRMGNDGVHLTHGSERVRVEGNLFEDVKVRSDVDGSAHPDAIQATDTTRDVIVSGNRVRGGRGFLFMVSPVHQDKPDRGHYGLVIENNILTGPDFGVRTFSTPGARIVNNTVWGMETSDTSGVHLNDRAGTVNQRSTSVVLANNVIRRLRVDPAMTFAYRDHNLIEGGPLAGPDDMLGTPVFVSPSTGDYHLKAGTIGVDAADPALAPDRDFDGVLRSSLPEIGALETPGTGSADTTAPTVSARSPLSGATGVAASSTVTATFSEAVQGVTGATFVLRNDATGAVVSATVSRNGTTNQYVLDPAANLAAGTRHTATLTGGSGAIRDLAGNPLVTTSWSFTTATATTTDPAPTVLATAPAAGALSVPVSATVTATFSEPVQGVSTTTFVLRNAASGATVSATVSRVGTTNQYVLDPAAALAPDARYTATLSGGSTAIRDFANQPLTTTSWSFTTGPAPTVSAKSPADGAIGVSRKTTVTVTFSEAVQGVSATTFVLRHADNGAVVPATVSRVGTTNQWILAPADKLAAKDLYTVSLTGGATAIRDSAGNPLASTGWSFTTGTS